MKSETSLFETKDMFRISVGHDVEGRRNSGFSTNYSPGYNFGGEFCRSFVLRDEVSMILRVNGMNVDVEIIDGNHGKVDGARLQFDEGLVPCPEVVVQSVGTSMVSLVLFLLSRGGVLHRVSVMNIDPRSLVSHWKKDFTSYHSCFVVNHSSSVTFQSFVNLNDYVVAIGCSNADVILVNTKNGKHELLSQYGKISRFWKDISSSYSTQSGIIDMAQFTYQGVQFVACLCSDGLLRLWNVKNKALTLMQRVFGKEDEQVYGKEDGQVSFTFVVNPLRLIQRLSRKQIDLLFHYRSQDNKQDEFVTCILKFPLSDDNTLVPTLRVDSVKYANSPDDKVIDFIINKENFIYVMWRESDGGYRVQYGPLYPQKKTNKPEFSWYNCRVRYNDIRKLRQILHDTTHFDHQVQQFVLEKMSDLTIFDQEILLRAFPFLNDQENLHLPLSNWRIRDGILKSIKSRNASQNPRILEEYFNRCVSCWLDINIPFGFCEFSDGSLGCVNVKEVTLLRDSTPMEILQDSNLRASFACLSENPKSENDMIRLANCLDYLGSQFTLKEHLNFDTELFDGSSLLVLTKSMTSRLKSDPRIIHEFTKGLNLVIHLKVTLLRFLDQLELNENIENLKISRDEVEVVLEHYSHVISNISSQLIACRYEMAKLIFILGSLLQTELFLTSHYQQFSPKEFDDFFERSGKLLKMYRVANWIRNTRISNVPGSENGFGIEYLQLDDCHRTFMNHYFECAKSELFPISRGSKFQFFTDVSILLVNKLTSLATKEDRRRLVRLMNCLVQERQFSTLKEFSRYCVSVLKFSPAEHYLGLAYLNHNQFNKSLQAFLNVFTVSYFVETEVLFELCQCERTGKNYDDWTLRLTEKPMFWYLYHLKFLCSRSLFLQTEICKLALKACPEEDSYDVVRGRILSSIFHGELQFQHFENAYYTIEQNPVKDYRMKDMKLFLTTLIQSNQLQLFIKFPYISIEHEVIEILTQRAKIMSPFSVPCYYELQSSFFLHRSEFRKAANSLYQWYQRVQSELLGSGFSFNPKEIEKYIATQHSALSTVISVLSMVEESNAWILFPNIDDEYEKVKKPSPNTRDRDGNLLEQSEYRDEFIQPLPKTITLEHIQKEFYLVKAKLQLIRSGNLKISGYAIANISGEDLYFLELKAKQYSMAFELASKLGLDQTPIYETMGVHYVSSTSRESIILEIQKYLDRSEIYESNYIATFLNSVISVNKQAPLPVILLNRLKEINPTRLLRIYLKHNLIHQGCNLVDSMLHDNSVDFNFSIAVLDELKAKVTVPASRENKKAVHPTVSKIEKLLQKLQTDKSEQVLIYSETSFIE